MKPYGDFVRVNDKIRISPVLVIKDGENLGVMPTNEAVRLAREAGLDLVEVSPNVRPPVCRIMDFGKFKYERSIKEKQQRKSDQSRQKEVRLRPVTGDHDLEVKVKAVKRFLEDGDTVLLKMKFERREIQHKDLGVSIIQQVLTDVAEVGTALNKPSFQGKMLTCLIGPKK